MPIYEYRCSSCGHQQEFLQRLSDAPLKRCTKCGEKAFSKMVTAAGFQLKGSGWYATDFRGSGTPPEKKSTEKAGTAAKSAESAGGEPAKSGTKTSGAPESPSTPASGVGASPASR